MNILFDQSIKTSNTGKNFLEKFKTGDWGSFHLFFFFKNTSMPPPLYVKKRTSQQSSLFKCGRSKRLSQEKTQFDPPTVSRLFGTVSTSFELTMSNHRLESPSMGDESNSKRGK
jgi:hypothetical protein